MGKTGVELQNAINYHPQSSKKIKWQKFLLYFILIFWSLVTIFPFYYMLVLSTKDRSEIFSFPPPLIFGDNLINNYQVLLEQLPFWRNVWNSVYIAVLATALTLFFCSLAGFGFAMYNFKGRKTLFRFLLATLMIPQLLNIIPFFVMMKFFGWIDRPIALYLPSAANAYGIFLMRQYTISSLPKELMDAARIDGCSEIQIYYRIALPLIKPGLAALGIITFLGSWNNFLGALVILQQKTTYTIPVALRSLQGLMSTDWGAVMIGTSLSVFPIILIFAFFSKQFISGLTKGALKG